MCPHPNIRNVDLSYATLSYAKYTAFNKTLEAFRNTKRNMVCGDRATTSAKLRFGTVRGNNDPKRVCSSPLSFEANETEQMNPKGERDEHTRLGAVAASPRGRSRKGTPSRGSVSGAALSSAPSK